MNQVRNRIIRETSCLIQYIFIFLQLLYTCSNSTLWHSSSSFFFNHRWVMAGMFLYLWLQRQQQSICGQSIWAHSAYTAKKEDNEGKKSMLSDKNPPFFNKPPTWVTGQTSPLSLTTMWSNAFWTQDSGDWWVMGGRTELGPGQDAQRDWLSLRDEMAGNKVCEPKSN